MIPVSICLTTWNRASILPKTLDSLLAQTFPDFEIIISDDASTDHTEEICRTYETKDSRVKYFRNARNLGMPGNLNAALRHASGAYIANVHDGDIYRTDLISKWKGALDAVPTAAFVFNDYEAVLPNGRRRLWRMPFDTRVPGEKIALHFFETMTSCVWGTVMARASAYAKAGPFDPAFGFISDVDMWLRLTLDEDAAYVGEPLITLAPRPEKHPFQEGIWRSAFWTHAIYARHLKAWRHKLPETVVRYRSAFPATRTKHLLHIMLSCLKHRRWESVREGLAIMKDADDLLLRRIGLWSGRLGNKPDWYEPGLWTQSHPMESRMVEATLGPGACV